MRVFKYGKEEYLVGLLRMGSLRIGTLSAYRKGEHAKGISDVSEGTKKVVNKIEKLNISLHMMLRVMRPCCFLSNHCRSRSCSANSLCSKCCQVDFQTLGLVSCTGSQNLEVKA